MLLTMTAIKVVWSPHTNYYYKGNVILVYPKNTAKKLCSIDLRKIILEQ